MTWFNLLLIKNTYEQCHGKRHASTLGKCEFCPSIDAQEVRVLDVSWNRKVLPVRFTRICPKCTPLVTRPYSGHLADTFIPTVEETVHVWIDEVNEK